MVNPIVYSYADSADVAKSLADHVVRAQDSALLGKESDSAKFNVAVSGGSLVKTLRLGLKDRSDVKWDKWNIFFADERLVKLDHEDSNYGLLKRDLLDHISAQPTVYTIDESKLDNASESADKYAELLNNNCDRDGPAPVLDLMLLGCGPDGHTCSLFPGHALLQEQSKTVAYLEDSPKPPPRRITLTLPVIKAANHVAFVAEGSGKAPVLKDIFEHPEKELPCAIVNGVAKRTTWFTNNEAVQGVNVPISKV